MSNDQPAQTPVPAKRIGNPLAWALWKIRQKNKAAQANVEVVVVDGVEQQISPRSPL
jgi:hypothetical protein